MSEPGKIPPLTRARPGAVDILTRVSSQRKYPHAPGQSFQGPAVQPEARPSPARRLLPASPQLLHKPAATRVRSSIQGASRVRDLGCPFTRGSGGWAARPGSPRPQPHEKTCRARHPASVQERRLPPASPLTRTSAICLSEITGCSEQHLLGKT